MYKISLAESQTYILSDESTASQVKVVPSRGGIVTEWIWQNQEIFYLDRERFLDPQLSVRGGIPLLFPICGNLENNSYQHQGQTYQLQQHGFARNLPWEVTAQSTDKGASLTVTLKSNEQTRQSYPFDFELNFTYTLKNNALELRYSHLNLSAEPMAFSTGIHPYFIAPDKQKLKFEIPSTQYQAKGEQSMQTFTGEFDFDQDEIDIAFSNLSGNKAIVTDSARNLQLTVEYDEHYQTLIFWTVKNKDFYCLEPWSSPRNALNTGEKLLVAQPGKSVDTQIILTVAPC
ncbi:galactose mutarotase-like enzyme [Gloeocapsa sp. PCC 73106]|uniref:aldose epimerase family protein n=1 Tax=Gloeocapsa sp. PCC 73106 TaxID=102232 RepID=UPI0002ABB3BE|nr:galactose mutarotase-like enzyme [Gloeocapsa sp. PCC 73106]ELR97199.1 galactose mutarotase-like enzyme [Gloeocapsa sp. PCC 73106]